MLPDHNCHSKFKKWPATYYPSKYHEPVASVDRKQWKQHIIILDYRVSVDLVASVDKKQQAQSRSTYHVQKTTNTTEINTGTTGNYGLGDLSTQLLKISWLLKATDSSQCFLMYAQIPVAIRLLPSSIQLSARVPGPTPWLDLPRDASLEPQTFCRWCFRLSSTSPAISTSSILPSFRLKGSLDLLAWCEVIPW